jgi:hypothetical protein
VNPAVLWPPNHKMVDVTLNYDVIAGCGGTTTSKLSVTSNEPVNGTDWVVLDPNNVALRADRSGTGTGRTYTITIFSQDSLGNAASQTVTVTVPHDNGHQGLVAIKEVAFSKDQKRPIWRSITGRRSGLSLSQ